MKLSGTAAAALALALLSGARSVSGSGLPVRTGHPRLLVNSDGLPALRARASAAGPAWLALKQRADMLATYTIFPYDYQNRTAEPNNSIFYDYQGEGWFRSTMPLGLAFLASGNVSYTNKLIALADELIRAQADPRRFQNIGLFGL